LMQAIPRLGEPTERLAVIPGMVPSPVKWPMGCRFHTRCPYAWPLTEEQHPELFEISPTHASRCWLEKYPEHRERASAGALERE